MSWKIQKPKTKRKQERKCKSDGRHSTTTISSKLSLPCIFIGCFMLEIFKVLVVPQGLQFRSCLVPFPKVTFSFLPRSFPANETFVPASFLSRSISVPFSVPFFAPFENQFLYYLKNQFFFHYFDQSEEGNQKEFIKN